MLGRKRAVLVQASRDRQSARQRRPQDRDNQAEPVVRRHKPRIGNLAAGLIAIVVIGAGCYFVFGGALPFGGAPFTLNAMFTSETELHIPSPVRMAGVDVGEVVSVHRVSKYSTASVVTMQINRSGLPVHANATAE